MRRILFTVFTSILLAGSCWIAWGLRRDKQLGSGLNRIKHGDPESEVVRLLGRPKRVLQGTSRNDRSNTRINIGDFMVPGVGVEPT